MENQSKDNKTKLTTN